ncbi:VOC family protein [Rhizobacter sp. LjRoot28]|jgi:PhnB protein|uniref:VOC family protein n=1 Tax=Rhizobacter sp. LjRoot28 TaxID=3342309 RepID=UPI003ECDC859
MPQLDPYLTFDGNCSEAMRFYADALGGKVLSEMKFGDTPGCEDMGIGPEFAGQTMHICIELDGRMLMGSDSAGQPFAGRRGISLALTYPTVDEARRSFDTLGAGGKVVMPMDKTFWAEAFGMVEDRFGTSWLINGAPIADGVPTGTETGCATPA